MDLIITNNGIKMNIKKLHKLLNEKYKKNIVFSENSVNYLEKYFYEIKAHTYIEIINIIEGENE